MGNPNWVKGVSGNPAGRPPKARALTAILEAAGNKTVEAGGKKVTGKRLLGRMLWEIATTGQTVMPDGASLLLDPGDWVGLVKWIYTHIDGPPKAELDVTSGGERIKGYIGVTPDDWPGTDETA
jgi:hypothetical protein